jgi:hypothetical protein
VLAEEASMQRDHVIIIIVVIIVIVVVVGPLKDKLTNTSPAVSALRLSSEAGSGCPLAWRRGLPEHELCLRAERTSRCQDVGHPE